MEAINCPMCGENQSSPLLHGPDLLHANVGLFYLVVCRHCEHIYQNPRPNVEEIDQYYPNNYIPFQTAIEDEPHWWPRVNRVYGRYRRCAAVHRAAGSKPGRLLDIGCATGIFLDGMRRFGWEVTGVEPTRSAATYAQERFGLDVFNGRLEDANLPTAHFDAITMWDVLEHVHEPRQIIAELARLLRPGGLLVLSMPNPTALEADLFGRFWAGWDLPRHLNLFKPTHLQRHLAEVGLDVQTIRSFTAGYAVFLMSLEHRLRHSGYHTQRLMELLNSAPMRLLAMPYYGGPAKWWNLSSIMVVFSQRVGAE